MHPILNSIICLIVGAAIGAVGVFEEMYKPCHDKAIADVAALNDQILTTNTEQSNAMTAAKDRADQALIAEKQKGLELLEQSSAYTASIQSKLENAKRDLNTEKARGDALQHRLELVLKQGNDPSASTPTVANVQPEAAPVPPPK
jgi:hypothetical protein